MNFCQSRQGETEESPATQKGQPTTGQGKWAKSTGGIRARQTCLMAVISRPRRADLSRLCPLSPSVCPSLCVFNDRTTVGSWLQWYLLIMGQNSRKLSFISIEVDIHLHITHTPSGQWPSCKWQIVENTKQMAGPWLLLPDPLSGLASGLCVHSWSWLPTGRGREGHD